jgi:hypothetical protein
VPAVHGEQGPVKKLNAIGECLQKLLPVTCTMRPPLSRTSRNAMRGYSSIITPPLCDTHGRSTVPALHHEWPTMKAASPLPNAPPRRP